MKIAVLGCGPAGLLAAHAVNQATGGKPPEIFSRKVRSPMRGAQYLHEPIPGLTDTASPDDELRYIKVGTQSGYAVKVYNDAFAPVSWSRFEDGHVPAWDIRRAYDDLWDLWEQDIEDIGSASVWLAEFGHTYDLVLSSVPAKALCSNPTCRFESQEVYINEQAQPVVHPNTIVYNGNPSTPWYRTSSVFGWGNTEWPANAMGVAVDHGAVLVHKPLWTSCDCNPNVVRLGRYGAWDKPLLTHHAYHTAKEVMEHAML